MLFRRSFAHAALYVPAAGGAADPFQQILDQATADSWDGLWDASNPNTLTLVDGKASQIDDAMGNLPSLVQATASKRPVWAAEAIGSLDAITGEPVDVTHMATATYSAVNQPNTRIVVCRGDSFGAFATVFRDDTELFVDTVWKINAGATLSSGVAADNAAHVITAIADDATSAIRIDGVEEVTGGAGTGTSTVLEVLGRSGDRTWDGPLALVLQRHDRDATAISDMETLLMSLAGIT